MIIPVDIVGLTGWYADKVCKKNKAGLKLQALELKGFFFWFENAGVVPLSRYLCRGLIFWAILSVLPGVLRNFVF